ncbi:MAG: acyltransferase [Defluviitaleaceae bacterium]|nr:acyltransferase [Defluviitaleaceae bacterium]MCL2835619.1 acyltransferase [Defluviitaleaceae bacterium]
MKPEGEYGAIDCFRVVAALLVAGIHTYPLSGISGDLNFYVIHVFARIAVPFFLMATGFFLSSPMKAVKKTGLLYLGATVLYLPVSIYAGHYSEGNIAVNLARNLIFDGTFYHLWYLPASIIGVLLLCVLGRKLTLRVVLGISLALYVFGLFGDSYFGVIENAPFFGAAYDALFRVSSYTRNGVFYAPVFLAMGAFLAKMAKRPGVGLSAAGFAASALLMLAEGALLRRFDLQRHDSMYAMLIPCVFFLFCLLLTRNGKARPVLRTVSLWIYILHPLVIIAVRGAARVTGLTGLLVTNNLIHYFAVCLLSCVFSVLIAKLQVKMHLY